MHKSCGDYSVVQSATTDLFSLFYRLFRECPTMALNFNVTYDVKEEDF